MDTAEGLWNLHILVDFCDGGSLSRLICDTQRVFAWRLRVILARDIACAMDYVHSKSIMHRDLTSMVSSLSILFHQAFFGFVRAIFFFLTARFKSVLLFNFHVSCKSYYLRDS